MFVSQTAKLLLIYRKSASHEFLIAEQFSSENYAKSLTFGNLLLSIERIVCMSQQDLSKENKIHFDRQIQLIGFENQARLMHFSAVVMGVKGAMGEVLKNLALTGLGKAFICEENGDVTQLNVNSSCLYLCAEKDTTKNQKHDIIVELLKNINSLLEINFVESTENLTCEYYISSPTSNEELKVEANKRSEMEGLQVYIFESGLGGIILLCEKNDLLLPSLEKIKSWGRFDPLLEAFCSAIFPFNTGRDFFPLSSLIGALVNQCILLRLTKGTLSFNTLTFNFGFPSIHPLNQMKSQTYLLL